MNLITMVPATAKFFEQMRAIEKFIADWNGRADAGRWKHAAQADDNVWDNELK